MKLHATLSNKNSQKTRSSNDFIRIQVRNEKREVILDYLVNASGVITGWHNQAVKDRDQDFDEEAGKEEEECTGQHIENGVSYCLQCKKYEDTFENDPAHEWHD